MKVEELRNVELDAAVAKLEGIKVAFPHGSSVLARVDDIKRYPYGPPSWSPSTDWNIAGPIIERERIEITPRTGGGWFADYVPMRDGTLSKGETPLIAAMRAYVASKFGDKVSS